MGNDLTSFWTNLRVTVDEYARQLNASPAAQTRLHVQSWLLGQSIPPPHRVTVDEYARQLNASPAAPTRLHVQSWLLGQSIPPPHWVTVDEYVRQLNASPAAPTRLHVHSRLFGPSIPPPFLYLWLTLRVTSMLAQLSKSVCMVFLSFSAYPLPLVLPYILLPLLSMPFPI